MAKGAEHDLRDSYLRLGRQPVGHRLAQPELEGFAFLVIARKHHDLGELNGGALTQSSAMADIVTRTGASTAQVALAWLMAKSPNILLIPSTSSLAHLESNIGARDVRLSEQDMSALDALSIE